jgi:hypothetical protein
VQDEENSLTLNSQLHEYIPELQETEWSCVGVEMTG